MAELIGLTTAEIDSIPLDQRLILYQGLALAIMMDPYSMDSDAYNLLSYGMFRDKQAKEAAKDTDYEWAMEYDIVAGYLNQEGTTDVLPQLQGQSGSTADVIEITENMGGQLEALRAGVYGGGEGAGVERSDDFLDLDPAIRKQVYDGLSGAMLRGEELTDAEYNLLGWAFGHESKDAKPSVSADGKAFIQFQKRIADDYPDAQKKLKDGTLEAFYESSGTSGSQWDLPNAEYMLKGVAGAVGGPLVMTPIIGGSIVALAAGASAVSVPVWLATAATSTPIKLAGIASFVGANGLLFASSVDNVVNYDENQLAALEQQQRAAIMMGTNQPTQWKYDPNETDVLDAYTGGGVQAMDAEGNPVAASTPGGTGWNSNYEQPSSIPGIGAQAYEDNPLIGDDISSIQRGLNLDRSTATEDYGGDVYAAEVTHNWQGTQRLKNPMTVEGRYFETDVRDVLDYLNPDTVIRIQEQMIRAGLVEGSIGGRQFSMGSRDEHTERALRYVMSQANNDGHTWMVSLAKLAIQGDEDKEKADADSKQSALDALGPFRRNAYLAPDYATLANRAKKAMEDELGRPINDWELELLTDDMQGNYRKEHNASESVRRINYDADVRAIEQDLTAGDVVGGGTVQDVDPIARFQETFDTQFENEIGRRDKTVEAGTRSDRLMQGLNNAMGAIGGR